MYTIVFAITLLIGSAEGNSETKDVVVLNNQSEIKIDRTFYHFDKEKNMSVQKDQSPMVVCFHNGVEIKCEKNPAQLINMPLLNFWSLNIKK